MSTPSAAAVCRKVPKPAALPLPAELPDLPPNPRVLLLVDGDCASHGLADGTTHGRASDQELRACLGRAQATAGLVDPYFRTRCAVSTETARHHLNVLAAAPNNSFAIRRGLDGADWALLEELADLAAARSLATRTGHKRTGRLPDLVLLVGQDRIYAPFIRQLRLLGIPCWLLLPSRFVAASLYSAACAASFIGIRQLA